MDGNPDCLVFAKKTKGNTKARSSEDGMIPNANTKCKYVIASSFSGPCAHNIHVRNITEKKEKGVKSSQKRYE
ncbi:expressed protein [Echinococcus multilocularis]|uniref:Expressed protein n=1 Tax=Echinococcus multilocularis TaxID=6211 RepID=A0A068XZ02_ECHMU|nr:expressed protein [Echinococcus multilocularis]